MKYAVRTGAAVEVEIHENVKYFDQSENLPRVKYSDVVSFEVVHGEAAALIEAESDGSCIDEFHEYLVLTFANGETSTFRNSHVDMFIIQTTRAGQPAHHPKQKGKATKMENNLKEIIFKRAKRARAEIEKFGDRSAIGSNAVNRWRVYESLLEEAGLMEEFEKWEATP